MQFPPVTPIANRRAACRIFLGFALLTGLNLLSALAHAGQYGFRAYDLGSQGTLRLSVPHSWNDQMRQPPEMPPTIWFTPEHGHDFNVQLVPVWAVGPDAVLPDIDEIKRMVGKAAEEAKALAAETGIPIMEISSETGHGYYFRITDRAPGPGEFKVMTRGLLRVGDLVLSFTVFSNEASESAIVDSLNMLKSARRIDGGD